MAARKVRDDGIHILIDLAGHTAQSRLDIFAMRAAPVQMSWLGYFNTTGLPAIDYLISDPVSSPPGDSQRFTETVLRLPQVRLCYQAPDYAPPPSPAPATRNGFITFGTFNQVSKINDAVVALWSKILHVIPDSRLLLKSRSFDEAAMQARIARKFAAHGIPSDRLLLRTHSRHAQMLAEYGDIDIALDTFPFNGGVTTCEALWQGVPVLALRGHSLIGRQSASFLAAMRMDDWIAYDEADYLAKAISHGSDFDRLVQLRTGLRQHMQDSPVCDAASFTRALEDLYASALNGVV